MSKGVAFIVGASVGFVGGVFGGVILTSNAMEHAIKTKGTTYILHNRETGEDEKWNVVFGDKPGTEHFGFVVKLVKEEKESNETEVNETSEDNREESISE